MKKPKPKKVTSLSTRFARALAKLDMPERAASHFLGVNERTVRRWVADDEPMHKAALMLVCLMARHGLTHIDALASIGIDAEKMRRAAEREWKKNGGRGFPAKPRYHEG